MKNIILFFIIACFAGLGATAQTQYHIGGPDNETATNIKILPDSSAIIAGYSYSISGSTTTNVKMILMRVKNTSILWQIQFGLPSTDNLIQDMIITHDTNIVVVGTIGRTGVYSNNTAAIMKFNSTTGAMMWQQSFHATPSTTGGEIFFGVTELGSYWNYDLVAVGANNFIPGSNKSLVALIHSNGVFAYDQVLNMNEDNFYSACTSTDGKSVYISGSYHDATGSYGDGRVLQYTPYTTSTTGTVNWSQYLQFTMTGVPGVPQTLNNVFFSQIQLAGSSLLIQGGALDGFSTTSGEGEFIVRMNAATGTGAQVWQLNNSAKQYSNTSIMTVVDSNHIYNVQSPAISNNDPIMWLSGTPSSAVVTEITSLSGMTSHTPVKYTNPSHLGMHSLFDIELKNNNLYMAGNTNDPLTYGGNDIYMVISPSTLPIDTAHYCDTPDKMQMAPFTPNYQTRTFAVGSITPTFLTVTTTPTTYLIDTMCGKKNPVIPCSAAWDTTLTTLKDTARTDTVSCTYRCIATGVPTTGGVILGYMWQVNGGTPFWNASSSGSNSISVTLTSYVEIINVTIYVKNPSNGDTCYISRYDTLKCGACNSFNTTLTTLTYGPGAGSGSGCGYIVTATGVTNPGWSVIGYLWQIGSSAPIWDPSTAGTDNQPATVPYSTSEIVSVTYYAIDAFGDTCTTTKTDTLSCGLCNSFDSTHTTLTHTGGYTMGGCSFTSTATGVNNPGWTTIGYLWQIGTGGPIWDPTSAGSDSQPVPLSYGGSAVITVWFYAVDAYGDTCITSRMDSVTCTAPPPCQAFDSTMTSLVPSQSYGDGCTYKILATGNTINGWTNAGYLWQIGTGSPIWDPSTSNTDVQVTTIPFSGTQVVTVTFYAVDSVGDTCKTTLTDTLTCTPPPCYDTTATGISYTSTTDSLGNCIITVTANTTTLNTIVGYEWDTTGGTAAVHHTSSTTDTYTFTLAPGSSTVVSLIIHIVDLYFPPGTSPCCEGDFTLPVSCQGVAPKGCFDTVTLTNLSGTFDQGCMDTLIATGTTSAGSTIVAYQWVINGGAPIIDYTSAGTDIQIVTIPFGTTIPVFVTIYAVDAYGDTCTYTQVLKIACSQQAAPCFDAAKTTLNGLFINTDVQQDCNFNCIANAVPLPGYLIVGYSWQSGPFMPSGAPTSTYPVTVPAGTSELVTVTIYAINALTQDTCKITLSLTLNCQNGVGSTSRKGLFQNGSNGGATSANDISIFPNPTTDMVQVTSTNTTITTIQVIDVNGQKVGNYTYDQTRAANISLSSLPPGAYLFRVNNTISKVVTKVK